MGFNLFSQNQTPKVSVTPSSIEPFSDTNKNEEITKKLFAKRKALEWNLANRPEARQEYEEELERLKESMAAFGLTNIEYEAYLVKTKETEH